MGLTASSGKTMYWEPPGYSIPLHIVGDLRTLADASITPGPRSQCEECGAAYAIIKVNELLQAVPEHPYVAFMDLYRVRKYSRNETGSELGRYRAFMLDQMIDVFQRKCDSDDDRWKDITLMDLKEMTLYICMHWQALGMYAHQATYDLQKRGIQLCSWFKAWYNCMAEDIWPLYMDRRQNQETDAAKRFVDEWVDPDEADKPVEADAEPAAQPPQPEAAVSEPIVLADESVTDTLLGPRRHHEITCSALLQYTMQFDVPESMLKACTDMVGLPMCGLWDKVTVGPGNFLHVDMRQLVCEGYPPELSVAKMEEANTQVKALYDKLVELTDVANDTKEAISASSVY